MKKYILSSLLIFSSLQIYSQTVKYAPGWYGPNALPVPELSDAKISSKTTIDITADYYFGFGDQTKNGYFRIEIPLLAEKAALKIWSGFLENFSITPELAKIRNIPDDREKKGSANSDIYVQTKIRLNKETDYLPSVILNSTLKTSSGTKHLSRRYFNTAGYYFDIEAGKSFYTHSKIIDEIRIAATLGFICWETDNFTQNDAPMFGSKIQFIKDKVEWESGIRGYSGWMSGHPAYGSDYGDKPLVGFTKLSSQCKKMKYYLQYQYGFRDFPYHQVRLGIQFNSEKLTPKFKE